MTQCARKILLLLLIVSFSYPYQNKFSFVNTGSGEGKLHLETTPDFSETADGYSRLAQIGEGHTLEMGMPELPQYTTFYQLDPEKTYDFQLEILESYVIENVSVLPHQGMDKWEVENVTIINQDFYSSYAAYPEENIIVSERSQGRGVEFVNIQVIPYKYFPKYQKLEVYSSIDIHVIKTGENPNPDLTQLKRSHIFDEFYKDLIVNFEESDRLDDYQAPAILYIAGGNWLNNSYVQDLIDWRHQQGYLVTAVSTSEIGASNGNENTIKNYIKDAYETWEDPPEIVGLIGDTDVIDCFYQSWGTGGWNYYNGATDFDYTQLDGNDLVPEVFIGRISGQATATMENVVNKTIQYEKALYVNDSWFNKAALVADPVESGNSTIFTSQYIENIMINHGLSGVATDYDGSGINNWLIDQFQDGISYYSYRGIYGDPGTSPSNSYNNGYHTPFATIMTCGTGDFDYGNSQSEEFVKMGSVSNPEGAVAAVGISTTGTHTAYNNILTMGIYDGIFPKKLWHAGAATANGDLAILATYPSNPSNATLAFIAWSNLIGDPALHLWTGTPEYFAVDHPSSIALGTTTTDVIVYDENGDPVADARVTLLMGNDVIFTTELTDIDGRMSPSWEAIESGTMKITVIKRNFRPYEGTIEISEAAGAALAMNSGELITLAGESMEFEISIHNYGNSTANGVIAELNSPSEHITFGSPIQEYGVINTQSTVTKSFPITIHGTAYELEDLELTLSIQDETGNNWMNHVPATISGPQFVITGYEGQLNPGISVDLSLTIENLGTEPANGFSMDILPYENWIFVNSEPYLIENVDPGEELILEEFNLDFSQFIINGSVIPMQVQFTSADGFSRNEVLNLTVGEVRESDPLGPDPYGYYIYDWQDSDHELAPYYDWIEIAEGVGEQLNLNDYGNGNYSGSYTYSSEVIDLPFTFKFYGVDYDQIVVNTNGWISFGDFEMYSFRNYPIPGAGGPSPMVAAFWDDLKTGSGGYVHYHAIDEMVVVQWNDMRTYDNNGNYRETFQIILYNQDYYSQTATGDGEIKIQYKDFNNTSDGYYPNGGTPIHGCYSTVGIENHLGDTGLEYTFNNVYPEAASQLEDRSAIFITTGRPPRVNVSIENVNLTNGTLNIFMENAEPIAGFQFELFGISVTGASGGTAEANDFLLSTSENMVLGFSTTGTVIPEGAAVLSQISFSDYSGVEICFGTDPINNVISNTFGNSLQTEWAECVQAGLLGDLNFDGALDILDIVILANLVLDGTYLSAGDMNSDGQLDILDIVSLVNIILS